VCLTTGAGGRYDSTEISISLKKSMSTYTLYPSHPKTIATFIALSSSTMQGPRIFGRGISLSVLDAGGAGLDIFN
jgi:hypothetical protein